MRTLILDIETAPMVVYVWQLANNDYVNPDNVLEDWNILSIGWAWGDGPTQYAAVNPKTPRDDKKLVKLIHGLLSEADLVVAHNGAAFDMRKIRARFLTHGFPPTPPVTVFDTKRAAKKVAAFSSNKLAWLAPILAHEEKEKHKEFPGLELWKECLAGNPKAWAEMERYNRQDVVTLQGVFKRLRPWVTSVVAGHETDESGLPTCPRCGSVEASRRGVTKSGTGTYQRYQCGDCGGWFRERTSSKRRRTAKEEA